MKQKSLLFMVTLLLCSLGVQAAGKVVFKAQFDSQPTNPTALGLYESINTEVGAVQSIGFGELGAIKVDFGSNTNIAAMAEASPKGLVIFGDNDLQYASVKVNGEEAEVEAIEYHSDGGLYIFLVDIVEETDNIVVNFTNPTDERQIKYTDKETEASTFDVVDFEASYNAVLDEYLSFMYQTSELLSSYPANKAFAIDANLSEFTFTFDHEILTSNIKATLDRGGVNVPLVLKEGTADLAETVVFVRNDNGMLAKNNVITVSNVLTEYTDYPVEFVISFEAGEPIIDGVRQRPVPQTINFVTDEEVYLYNIGTGMFFSQGNSYGTQASLDTEGRVMKFVVNSDVDYTLWDYCTDYSGSNYAWRNVFYASSTSMFVDRAGQADYFFTVVKNSDNTFRISSSNNNPEFAINVGTSFIGVKKNYNSTALEPFLNPATDDCFVDWVMISKDNYDSFVYELQIYNKASELKEWIDKIYAQNGDASSLVNVYLNKSATLNELQSAIDRAQPLYIAALIGNASDKENVDVTLALTNPAYENGTAGWTVTKASGGNVAVAGTSSNKCFEAYNNQGFDIYQEIGDLPVGVYEIEVQGFYRYLRDQNAWNSYKAQNVEYVKRGGAPVYVYLNNNSTPFVNIFDEPISVGSLYTTDGSLMYPAALQPFQDGEGHWYPNEMYNSALAFANGMYTQSAYGLVANSSDLVRIGVKGKSNQGNDSWVIWDNFKLYYRGFKAEVVQPVLETAMTDLQQYSNLLMGKTEYAKLSSAMTEAQSSIANQDGEAMFKALNALYDVKEAVIASKDLFLEQDVASDTLRLSDSITVYSAEKISNVVLQDAKKLLNDISNNLKYENNQIAQLKNDVDAVIESLKYSLSQYGRFAEYIDALHTKIEEVGDWESGQSIKTSASTLYSEMLSSYENGMVEDKDIDNRIGDIIAMMENLNKIYEYIADSDWVLLRSAYLQMTDTEKWVKKWNFDTDEPTTDKVPGVKHVKGHITSVDLSENNLTGYFPYELLALPYLESINLSGNNLSGDIGTTTAVYARQNPTRMLALKNLDISGNQFSGNIGIFAKCFPNLTSLNASDNCLEDVFPMVSATVTSLDISKQTISRVVPIYLADMSEMSLATKIPSILLYNHEKQAFTTNLDLHCITSYDSFEMTMSYQNGVLAIPYISEQNTYYGNSGDTLNVAVVNSEGEREGSTFRISLKYDEGDCNFDGKIDVLDLQTDILYIMENYKQRPFNFTAANLWKDDVINVQDVICYVNMLMDQESEDDENVSNARAFVRNSNAVADAEVEVCDGQLMLNSNQEIAAFDITISGANNICVDKNLERMGMTINKKVQENSVRIIGYSLNGACIPAGLFKIGSIGRTSYVRQAMLSDSDANEIKVSCGATITGIKITESKPEHDKNIYDIQGRKVNGMDHKGIYIQNGRKIMK